MRGAGHNIEFLNIWLDILTNKFDNYSKPVASNISTTITTTNVAKLDSGATQHYIKQSHDFYLQNLNIGWAIMWSQLRSTFQKEWLWHTTWQSNHNKRESESKWWTLWHTFTNIESVNNDNTITYKKIELYNYTR